MAVVLQWCYGVGGVGLVVVFWWWSWYFGVFFVYRCSPHRVCTEGTLKVVEKDPVYLTWVRLIR